MSLKKIDIKNRADGKYFDENLGMSEEEIANHEF